jgi:hypothetical protein
MSSFDSEDILGTSCFMEPNMDAIFQQSINDVKHDEERRAYLERCLAQVFRMDNIMDGIRDMMDDELKLYGVAETKWKRKTVLDKVCEPGIRMIPDPVFAREAFIFIILFIRLPYIHSNLFHSIQLIYH